MKYDKTFISLDFGKRRIGIAKSDATGLIASPLMTLEYKSINKAAEQIAQMLVEYEANGLVVGYPLYNSGDKSEICEAVDKFVIKILKHHDLPVYRQDERHTSQQAAAIIHAHGKKIGQDKRRLDRIAAVLILERFLETIDRDSSFL
jgi:putative Holliday junction resolvase